MGSSEPKPAYLYEEDEDGRRIKNTKKSAKQKSSKSRSDTLSAPEDRRKSKSDTGPQYDPAVSGAKLEATMAKLERRKSTTSNSSPKKSQPRPQSSHTSRALPKLAIPVDHPSYFGVSNPASTRAPPVSQPYPPYPVSETHPYRARPSPIATQSFPTAIPTSRPSSYHAPQTSAGYGSRPPISSSAFYSQPVMAAPSYPPPSPSSSYIHYAATTPQEGYFTLQPAVSRTLASRFESPSQRNAPTYDVREADVHQRQIRDTYADSDYASVSEAQPPAPRRRNSIRVPSGKTSTRAQRDIDVEAMPPPPRPVGILRNRTTEYYADSAAEPPRETRPVYRDASPIRVAHSDYRDESPARESRTGRREAPAPRRKSAHRSSASYDLPQVRVETANTSHRRQSYYGQSASTSSAAGSAPTWEEKLRDATGYQEVVAGPTAPLSAESLRRHQRREGGSSRSTKSSGSQDESEYKKSATTHTTQSFRGQDEDFTIKVRSGQARITLGNTQIECAEGGEVEVSRPKTIRNGSERSSSNYGDLDDRRSRTERPAGRSRMSSQSRYSYDRPIHHAPRDDFF